MVPPASPLPGKTLEQLIPAAPGGKQAMGVFPDDGD